MAAVTRVGGMRPMSGWLSFAAIVMVLAGSFSMIDGLVALIHDEVYVATKDGIVAFDYTVWGLIHLAIGALLTLAAFAILTGQVWARLLGIVFAMASAIAHVGFITAFPIWSLVIVGVDVLVLYGLIVHGEEAESY